MVCKGASIGLKLRMVGEPVADQGSPMETNIMPDNNKPGPLWSVLYSCIVKCIQKCYYMFGIEGT